MKCGKQLEEISKPAILPAPPWESCEIIWDQIDRAEYYFHIPKMRFVADAISPKGQYIADQSVVIESASEGDTGDPRVKEACSVLVTRLVTDGWEPLPQRGKDWWNYKFRRQVPRTGEEALALNERSLQLNPNNVRAWKKKGEVLQNLKRDEEALEAYDRALQLDPKYPDAWIAKGTVFFGEANLNEALQAFERVLQFDSKNVGAWYWKGAALAELKRYEEALKACEQAIKFQATAGSLWRQKGDILTKLNRTKEAQKAYQLAVKLGG
jgi:tetratricopeptide (TPR) repeat protein